MGKYIFEIDGGEFEVEADTPELAVQKVRAWRASQQPKASEPEVGVLEDSARGFGSGVVKGFVGMASIPNLLEQGADWVAERFGGNVSDPGKRYTYDYNEIKDAAEENLPLKSIGVTDESGELYDPKTRVGKVAGTIGEFSSGMVLPGGGGLALARGAGNLAAGTARAAATKTAAAAARRTALAAARQGVRTAPSTMLRRLGQAGNAAQQAARGGAQVGDAARRFAVGAALPGATSERAGQAAEGTSYEPWARLAGGLAGAYVPAAATRIVSPVQIRDPDRLAAFRRLRREGIDPTPANVSGSDQMRAIEGTFEMVPFGKNITDNVEDAFTRAALRRAGINATPESLPRIDRPSVTRIISDQFDSLGQRFDQAGRYASIDGNLRNSRNMSDIRNAVDVYRRNTSKSNRVRSLQRRVADLDDKITRGNGLTGDQYIALRKEFSDDIRGTSDPGLREAYSTIVRNLDDMAESTINRRWRGQQRTQFLDQFQNLRTEYRNLASIDEALSGASKAASEGRLTPQNLRAAVEKRAKGARNTARNDLKALTEDARGFMIPYQDSGTPARSLVQNTLMLGGGAAGGLTANAEGALVGLGVGALTPAVASNLYGMTPMQRWLRNQRASEIGRLMAAARGNKRGNFARTAVGSIPGMSETQAMQQYWQREE